MTVFENLARKGAQAYPSRSQASWREQWKLEGELKQCGGWIARSEEKIARLKEDSSRVAIAAAKGQVVHPSRAGEIYAELETEKRNLATCKQHVSSLQTKIKALANPSPSQVAARTRQQDLLSRLARERLEVDRRIDCKAKELRLLLERRKELSAKMSVAASAIDLKTDGLDEVRFHSLQESLPPDGLGRESEQWVDWFTGNEKNRKAYVVRAETLVISETLASSGAHRCGDVVQLSEEQVRTLLSDSPTGYAAIEPCAPKREKARSAGKGSRS